MFAQSLGEAPATLGDGALRHHSWSQAAGAGNDVDIRSIKAWSSEEDAAKKFVAKSRQNSFAAAPLAMCGGF